MEDAEGEEGETDSKKPSSGLTTPGFQKSIPVPPVPLLSVVTKPSILSRCYPFSYSSTVPFLPSGRIEDCLPPCYREQAKYMSKLIKVSVSVAFGVLFHIAFVPLCTQLLMFLCPENFLVFILLAIFRSVSNVKTRERT